MVSDSGCHDEARLYKLTADEARMKALVGLHPIGPLDEAEEETEVVLFLASPGTQLVVDGGNMASQNITCGKLETKAGMK